MTSGAMDELRVEVPPEELASLADWLADNETLRGHIRPQQRPPEPGHLGAVVDLLTVALGSGGVGVALVQSLCTWLRTRQPGVTITVQGADGRSLRIDFQRAHDPEALIRLAGSLLDGEAE
jgi:Effector Associated Constant Component 1